jgi:hypothetical protein
VVENCGSFLTIEDETVHLIHQSAKDYLRGDLPSRLQTTTVDVHGRIIICSIEAMSRLYEARQYRFLPEDTPLLQKDLDALQYACLHWMDHLHDAITILSENGEHDLENKSELCQRSFSFLTAHFLKWIESANLLNKTLDAITAIERLVKIVKVFLKMVFYVLLG